MSSSSKTGFSTIGSITQAEMHVKAGDWLEVGISFQTRASEKSGPQTFRGRQPFQVPAGLPNTLKTEEFIAAFREKKFASVD